MEDNFKTIDVTQKFTQGRRSKTKSEDLLLNEAYSKPPGITENKMKDLLQLCDANVIPH